MTIFIRPVGDSIAKITCDVRDCGASLEVQDANQWEAEDRAIDEAIQLGWRRFVSRGHRDYCPAHGPSKRSRAREVWQFRKARR